MDGGSPSSAGGGLCPSQDCRSSRDAKSPVGTCTPLPTPGPLAIVCGRRGPVKCAWNFFGLTGPSLRAGSERGSLEAQHDTSTRRRR